MGLQKPLDRALVQKAIQMVLPAFQAAAETGTFVGASLYVVVMDPRKRPGDYTFGASILGEFEIGPKAGEFKVYALAKARRGWETGKTGEEIRSLAPHLLDDDDTKYTGDAQHLGLVVAASGIQAYYDELVSWWLIHTIIALCKEATAQWDTSEDDMIGK